MASSKKTPAADRSHGGPGSTPQNADKPGAKKHATVPGEPTNARRSRISGGGGERDRHHSHAPADKS